MKASEIRELDDAELQRRLGSLREELFNLRFQLATGQLENTSRVRQVRKDIARIMTILHERELAQRRVTSAGRGK
ncbi:MAG TPA: 50S ribosomal protein L29 [Firmicutes bacterium]|nr:50S ribosomal protein L29 [Bacillota bacterium]